MRRATLALAVLLWAASAGAVGRTVIIGGPQALNNANFNTGEQQLEHLILGTINARYPGAADFVRSEQLQDGTVAASPPLLVDQWLRSGKVWKLGMGVGTPTTYGLVIHLGVSGSATYSGGYNPDSSVLIGNATNGSYWPTVVHLYIPNMRHTAAALARTGNNRESTGVSNHITYSAAHDSTLNLYEVGATSRTWKSYVGFPAYTPTRINRGWRPLVGMVSTRMNSAADPANLNHFDDVAPFTDNITGVAGAYSTNPDTVASWIVLNNAAGTNTPIAGTVLGVSATAAPEVFVGLSGPNTQADFDVGLLLGALAIADSLSGGALSANTTRTDPVQIGVHIDDGWKRGDSNGGAAPTGGGGIAWSDSTALKGSITLMNSLPGLKAVVGVEADSIGDLANYDDRWWAAATFARFTPHCHGGQSGSDTHTQLSGGSKFMYPLDIWGLNRYRYAWGSLDSALAYGRPDYVNEPADTASTYWLNKRAFTLVDSVTKAMYGAPRTDHLVMPPADDWTNTRIVHAFGWNVAHTITAGGDDSLGNAVDSVMAAGALSGASAFRSNAGSVNSATIHNTSGNTGYGYYTAQQAWTVNATGSPTWVPVARYGTPCNVLSTSGYPNTTASPNTIALASQGSWSQLIRNKPGYYQYVLRSVLTGGPVDWNSWTGSALAGPNVKTSIIAMHVCDLGSRVALAGGENNRPGYYNLKYLCVELAYANAHALKPLVVIDWPDRIKP